MGVGVLLMVCLAALVHGARNPFAPRVASSRSHHHHHHRQHHRQQLADVPGVVFPPVDSSDSDSNDHESVQEVAKDEEDYEDAEHMIDTGRERRPFRFSKGDEGSLQHSVDRENEHAQAKIAEYGQRLAHCSTRQCRKRLRRKIATRREEISQRGRDLDRVMGLINAGGNSKEIKRLISALLKKEMHATDPISLDLIDQEEETEDAEVKNIYHIKRNEKECQSGRCRQRMKRRELSVYNNGNIRRKSLNHLIERIKLVEV